MYKQQVQAHIQLHGGSHLINVFHSGNKCGEVAIQLIASHYKNQQKIRPCETHWLIGVRVNHFSSVRRIVPVEPYARISLMCII